jgi:hypothetical protein
MKTSLLRALSPVARLRPVLGTLTAITFLAAADLEAGDRKFAYSYEATTMPKGSWELENWFTWKHYDGDRERFDFRHELEYGVTDRLQLAWYMASWRHEKRDGISDTSFRSTSIEAIYNLTDPTEDLLGSALYGEVGIGPEQFKLEGKILLQKNIGPFVIAANSIIESEWEGEKLSNLNERKGELAQTIGISYQVSPAFAFGMEGFFEIEIEDWSDFGHGTFYIGPNVSWRHDNLFVTAAGLWQTTGVEGEPEVQTRILFGFDF